MSTLIADPLRLERHFFNQVQITALPEREKDAPITVGANVVEGQRTDGTEQFRVVVDVVFGPANGSKPGYEGKVQAEGYFRCTEPCSPAQAKQMVGTAGVDLLFDAVRELVCNLTARGPWPMLRLPRIVFQEASESGPSPKKTAPRTGGKGNR